MKQEQIIAAARQLQEARLRAIQDLIEKTETVNSLQTKAAEKRAALEKEISEETKTSKLQHTAAYKKAITAGWSETELRKLGLGGPKKTKPRTKPVAPAEPEQQLESAPQHQDHQQWNQN